MNPQTVYGSFVRCDISEARCETHDDFDRLGSSCESCNRILSDSLFSREYEARKESVTHWHWFNRESKLKKKSKFGRVIVP